MSVRFDCRIEQGSRIHALGASPNVRLDLCFTVGDALTITPSHQRLEKSIWYSAIPSGPVLFMGLAIGEDRLRESIRWNGIGNPALPFFSSEVGIVYLPLLALDEVIRGPGNGPYQRSQWSLDL